MAKRAAKSTRGRKAAGRKGGAKAKSRSASNGRRLTASVQRQTAKKKHQTKTARNTKKIKKIKKNAGATKKTASKSKTTARSRRAASPAATAVKGTLAGMVQAIARRLPGASKTPDALTLLEQDHRRLEELLKAGEETSEAAAGQRGELLHRLALEIGIHEQLEETLLYPALKQYPEAAEIVREGYEEHHVADLIVRELYALATDDSQWGAKFKVLKENIEHHIEEEEGEMFRTARAVMSRQELQRLGAAMAKMKAEAER